MTTSIFDSVAFQKEEALRDRGLRRQWVISGTLPTIETHEKEFDFPGTIAFHDDYGTHEQFTEYLRQVHHIPDEAMVEHRITDGHAGDIYDKVRFVWWTVNFAGKQV